MNNQKLILVVEDDPDIGELLVDILGTEGYTAERRATGREALEVLEREHVDLLLLDLVLPDMGGNQILDRLSSVNSSIPVVVVSANLPKLVSTPQVKATLPKPFDLGKLLNLVERFI